jgi:carboxymethylenebutenolidase
MDQRLIDLFDRFTHGGMSRRAFLERLTLAAGSTAAASAALAVLENDYARAETVPADDPGLKSDLFVVTPVKGLQGYLVGPKGGGRRPGVLVIHENRGLNPHIKDVARRVAKAGYLAFTPDFLSPLGGTPTDPDKARDMFGQLKTDEVVAWAVACRQALARQRNCTGRIGAVGFCWGGGTVNELAAADPDLRAGVAYYGRQIPAEKVRTVKAPLMLHYAGLDERINAGIPAFEAALKAEKKTYEIHLYPGVNHAFNNDANAARYDMAAADLAWSRTLGWFGRHLK